MKTITEFSGFQLGEALKNVEQFLAQAKYEGDKLKFFNHALEMAKERPQNLKRILVLSFQEGEKKPEKAVEKEGHFYLPEFFFVPTPKREKRFQKKGGRNKKNKRRRPPRGPRKNPPSPQAPVANPATAPVSQSSKPDAGN